MRLSPTTNNARAPLASRRGAGEPFCGSGGYTATETLTEREGQLAVEARRLNRRRASGAMHSPEPTSTTTSPGPKSGCKGTPVGSSPHEPASHAEATISNHHHHRDIFLETPQNSVCSLCVHRPAPPPALQRVRLLWISSAAFLQFYLRRFFLIRQHYSEPAAVWSRFIATKT